MKKTIYCGTEDYVLFFNLVVKTLGLDIKYEIQVIDGEYEIEIIE